MSDPRLQQQQDNIRIPAYDTEGFRTDSYGLDQMLVNCFAETVRNPLSGDGEIVVTKRNGIPYVNTITFTSHFTAAANTQYAIANYCVTNLVDVYVSAWVDGNNIRIIQYRPQAGTTALLGTIATAGLGGYHRVYFSHGWVDSSKNPTWTLTITFEEGYDGTTKAYTCEASGAAPNTIFTAASIAQITNVNSPWGQSVKTRGPILQYNNQWYVACLDGRVYNTGNALPTSSYVSEADVSTTAGSQQSWCNQDNFITSEFPEQFEGIILFKHHLVAFGKTSIQFFTDEGEIINPGSPMLRTDQALIRFGCISGRHMISVDDVLYWIGYGRDNTVGMWKLDGYTPVKLSNKRMDGAFATRYTKKNGIQTTNLFSLVCGNKKHIGISGVIQTCATKYDPDGVPSVAGIDQALGSFDTEGTITMYNLEDKTWWSIYNDNSGSNVGGFLPVTSFGNPSATAYNIDAYQQYILKFPLMVGTTFVASAINKYLYTVSQTAYEDSMVDNTEVDPSYGYWVQMTIQFNGIEFQNLKRKRFTRATIIPGNSHLYETTWHGGVGLGWTDLNTQNFNDTINDGFRSRGLAIPNTIYRYYFNNLGMARHRSFVVTERSPKGWQVKGLEIDLAQGTG
jgi:hypothetical protein